MNNRQNALAVLNYEKYERLPIVHFGYWSELLEEWRAEGRIENDLSDTDAVMNELNEKLGFDFEWATPCFSTSTALFPGFKKEVLETRPDGKRVVRNSNGLIELEDPNIVSIPATIGTTLTDRDAWEREYLPRLAVTDERVNFERLDKFIAEQNSVESHPVTIHAGSLYGKIRDLLGVENLAYLSVDDEDLYCEIIKTFADISYNNLKLSPERGYRPDVAHYWEDICFKNGPLVTPKAFYELVGPYYRRNSELLASYGCKIVSLDCDGLIDALIPTWIENGVNTMFPIEYGTWHASIKPWRERYGRELRGVGGMNKNVFALERSDIDKEVERLKSLVELGGFIPCPDHRIPLGAKWDNIRYYTDKMNETFNK